MKDIVERLRVLLGEDESGWLFERRGTVFRLTHTLLLQREVLPHVFVRVADLELQRALSQAVDEARAAAS